MPSCCWLAGARSSLGPSAWVLMVAWGSDWGQGQGVYHILAQPGWELRPWTRLAGHVATVDSGQWAVDTIAVRWCCRKSQMSCRVCSLRTDRILREDVVMRRWQLGVAGLHKKCGCPPFQQGSPACWCQSDPCCSCSDSDGTPLFAPATAKEQGRGSLTPQSTKFSAGHSGRLQVRTINNVSRTRQQSLPFATLGAQ